MTPLLINEAVRAEIKKVVAHAETHPFSLQDLHRLKANPDNCAGNRPAHVVIVPHGYRCVFSMEEHPMGMCRHLSVSMKRGKVSPVVACLALAGEFGFERNQHIKPWSEPVDAHHDAVNLLQPVEVPQEA